jgi:uncharacterized protein YlxP (DUF503 family)
MTMPKGWNLRSEREESANIREAEHSQERNKQIATELAKKKRWILQELKYNVSSHYDVHDLERRRFEIQVDTLSLSGEKVVNELVMTIAIINEAMTMTFSLLLL